MANKRTSPCLSAHFENALYDKSLLLGYGALSFGERNQALLNTIVAELIQKENSYKVNKNSFFEQKADIGLLTVFQRGDVFKKNGYLTNIKNNERKQKFKLSINISPFTPLEPISEYIDGRTDDNLSYAYHQQWALKENAYDTERNQEYELIIPSSAIISFYLPHSCLLKAALSRHGVTSLYNKKLTQEGFKGLQLGAMPSIHYIHLRKEIYDVASPHVARIYYNEYAQQCFEEIGSKSASKSLPSGLRSVYARPFVYGQVNWEVTGKVIPNTNKLIVSTIKSCSGEYPFKQLIFGRDNDHRGKATEYEDHYLHVLKANTPALNEEDEDEDGESNENNSKIFPGTPTNNEVETVHLILDESPISHSGLSDVHICKINKLTLKHPVKRTFYVYTEKAVIDGLSHMGSSALISGLHLAQLESGIKVSESKLLNDNTNLMESNIKPLQELVNVSNKIDIDGLEISFRNIKTDCDSYQQLGPQENVAPEKYRDLEPPASWVMLSSEKSKILDTNDYLQHKIEQVARCRRFVILQFRFNNQFSYLIEFQKVTSKE